MLRGQTLAEQVSLLTAKDIEEASQRANFGLPGNGTTGSRFLQAV